MEFGNLCCPFVAEEPTLLKPTVCGATAQATLTRQWLATYSSLRLSTQAVAVQRQSNFGWHRTANALDHRSSHGQCLDYVTKASKLIFSRARLLVTITLCHLVMCMSCTVSVNLALHLTPFPNRRQVPVRLIYLWILAKLYL